MIYEANELILGFHCVQWLQEEARRDLDTVCLAFIVAVLAYRRRRGAGACADEGEGAPANCGHAGRLEVCRRVWYGGGLLVAVAEECSSARVAGVYSIRGFKTAVA